MNKEIIGFRADKSVKQAVKAKAKKLGLSLTEAMHQAVSQWLLNDNDPVLNTESQSEQEIQPVIQKGCVCEGFQALDIILRATQRDNWLLVCDGWLWLKDKSPNGSKVILKAIGEVPSDLTYKSLLDLYRQLTSCITKADTPAEIVEAVLKVYEEEDHYQIDRMKSNQSQAVERLEYLLGLDWFDLKWVTGHTDLFPLVPNDMVWADTEPRSMFLAPSLENLESRYQALARELSERSTVCP